MIDRPAARYGGARLSPRVRRRWAVASTLLVVVAGVVIAVIGYQRLGRSEVSGELAGYEIVGASTLAVTVSVTRDDPGRPAVCILRGRARDGSENGRREVLVPPSDATTVQVRALVTTLGPPGVGDVYGCGLDVPGYLVAPTG